MVESNTSAKYKDAKLKSVDVLTTNDVLCGRGGKVTCCIVVSTAQHTSLTLISPF
jgi:hypothetical protein